MQAGYITCNLLFNQESRRTSFFPKGTGNTGTLAHLRPEIRGSILQVKLSISLREPVHGKQSASLLGVMDRSSPFYSEPSGSASPSGSSPLAGEGGRKSFNVHWSVSAMRDVVFKDPFSIEKTQLIRHLIKLPACVTATIQACRSQSTKIETPFTALAAKLALEEEEAQNPEEIGAFEHSNEQVSTPGDASHQETKERAEEAWKESSEEAWQESSGAGMHAPKKQRVEAMEALPGSSMTTLTGLFEGNASCTQQDTGSNGICSLNPNDEVCTSDLEERQWCESGTREATPETLEDMPRTSMGSHDVANWIIKCIRVLRHSRPGNTTKLMEMLLASNIPVEKCYFVEQLIQQAYRYNKKEVAQKLVDYLTKCRARPC